MWSKLAAHAEARMERTIGIGLRIVLATLLAMVTGAVMADADELFHFEIELVKVDIPGMPGLHSFAFGQVDGVWLLLGGRLDGLHARQSARAFPASDNNTALYVVDIASRSVWSESVLNLPIGLAEQLQSTNMNFYQDGHTLYVIGGYGYSATAWDYVTFPNFTVIDVAGLVLAVRGGDPIEPYFRQISGNEFAVAGGQLGKIGRELFLVGGHRFDGRYNPMRAVSFRQEYTNQIQVFSVQDDKDRLQVELLRAYADADHLHRRDFNLVPQRFPDGTDGYMISAGVFQANADLPFLYPVDVTASGYVAREEFQQLLSHYHSAKLPLYDAATGEMHSIFFGGMAQYYYRDDTLVRDDKVPFVNTISRVTRDSASSLTEYILPLRMPGLVGAGGEFVPNLDLLRAGSRVFQADDIGEEPVVVGHIVGGIQSPDSNPFFSNRTGLTAADSTVYEVRLTRRPVLHSAVAAP
jgi:hypothetical protein